MPQNPKALPGQTPEHSEPTLQEHDWSQEGTGGTDAFGAPSWLNNEGGTISRTCRRCGCELLSDGASIRADAKVQGAPEWVYRDYRGREIRSFVPLSCPLVDGSPAVALEHARIGKVQAQKAGLRAEQTAYRITQLEQEIQVRHEATLARIAELEAENHALKEKVGTVSQLDLGQLAEKLFELAEAARARKALEPVESKGRVVQIPKELADVIDVVGIPVEGELLEDDE